MNIDKFPIEVILKITYFLKYKKLKIFLSSCKTFFSKSKIFLLERKKKIIKKLPDKLVKIFGGYDIFLDAPLIKLGNEYNNDYLDLFPDELITKPLVFGYDCRKRYFIAIKFKINTSSNNEELDNNVITDIIHQRYSHDDLDDLWVTPMCKKDSLFISNGQATIFENNQIIFPHLKKYINSLRNNKVINFTDSYKYQNDHWKVTY